MKQYLFLLFLLLFSLFYSCNKISLSSSDIAIIREGKYIQVSSHDTTGGNNDRINIPVGQTAVIFDQKGPGMITRIWVTIDSRDPYFLRRILIRMYWDDEESPSVQVPIGDFFGSPFEYKHFAAENIGMTSGGYFCYFPMPFNKKARIEIVNETGQEVFAFYFQVGYYQLPDTFEDNTGYFHAFWKRDIRTNYNHNYVALKAKGKGQFVGLHFSAQPYNGSLGYLEGDEMFYVDDEAEPSIYGTGTEDYFTSGWYFNKGEFASPFHGLVLKDEENGRITAYRHHIRDAVPFKDSIEITFEHGHGNESTIDLSTVAFWYQTEPHQEFSEILPAGLRIPLRRPVPNGALEAENLSTSGESSVEEMSDYGSDWSNGKQLVISLIKDSISILNIPALRENAYNVDLYSTKGPGFGAVEILNKGQVIAKFNNEYSEMLPADTVSLKGIETESNSLKLEFRSIENDTKIGIDAVVLTPVRDYIPEWYMIGPFPNPRESDYLRYGLDSIYAPEKEIDLKATYTGVNGQQIRWEKVDGKDAGYGMGLWNRYNPSEFIVCYALTYIFSPDIQEVPLMFSSDDGSKIFLNDKEIYRYMDVNVAYPDQFEIPLKLNAGWNKLLIKIENNFGGYAFYARLIDHNQNLSTNINPR